MRRQEERLTGGPSPFPPSRQVFPCRLQDAGEGKKGRKTRTYAPARPDQRSRNRDQSHA